MSANNIRFCGFLLENIYVVGTHFGYLGETFIMSANNIHFCGLLLENICCRYSLEAPWRGTSNDYPQHIFSWRNKKIFT